MKITLIEQERKRKKWSTEFVSKQLGITPSAVRKIETLQRKPSYDVLIKLCKLFNVETNDIQQLFAVVADTPISRQNDTTEDE